MYWQRRARLLIAVVAVGFAVVLAFAFRDRPAPDAAPPVVLTDPGVLLESAGGQTLRIDRDEERVRIDYQRMDGCNVLRITLRLDAAHDMESKA